MALPIDTIEKILTNKGFIRFSPGDYAMPYDSGLPDDRLNRAAANHWMCTSRIGVNDIALRAVDHNNMSADAVNVAYVGDFFTFGRLRGPGYIYSDGFAGCSFYLYRSPTGEAWGVHASRERGKVCDPTHFFNQRGFKLIWQWNSIGKLTDQQLLGGHFSAVLCCIDLDTVYAYALTMKGQQVAGIRDGSRIVSWTTFSRPPMTPPPSRPSVAARSTLTRVQRLKKAFGI